MIVDAGGRGDQCIRPPFWPMSIIRSCVVLDSDGQGGVEKRSIDSQSASFCHAEP